MDLIEGNNYYLMSEESHCSEIDQEHFETFKKCKFLRTGFTSSGHVSEVYLHHTFYDGEYEINLYEEQVGQKIFKNVDEVLRYLYMYVENLGEPYRLDSYLKNRIIISQKENPELWI